MKNHQSSGSYYLRSGLTIYPWQQGKIEEVLAELGRKVPARFLMLSDVTGQVVLSWGEQNNIDLVALGSLVAGDLAASQEIARRVGAYEEHQMVLREGQDVHILITGAGHHLALFAQISTEVPLGWARLLIHKAVDQLVEITAAPPATQKPSFDLGLDQADLPDLFNDALDDIWKD